MSENKDNSAFQDIPDHLTRKKKKAIEMRNNGYTVRKIAMETGVSVGWVQKVTREPVNTP